MLKINADVAPVYWAHVFCGHCHNKEILELVFSQRLLRRQCLHCSTPFFEPDIQQFYTVMGFDGTTYDFIKQLQG